MDPNRTVINDPNRTLLGDPNRTQIGDPNRTQMSPGPPGPASGVSLDCRMGNPYILSTSSTTGHILIQATAGDGMGGRRQPLNLSLVIDRSGSMEGEPLAYVKQACNYVVDLLAPEDILSVVTFEEQVDVLMPARRVVNKALIKEHLSRIAAGRTTNLFDGLVAGGAQVASVPAGGYLKRLLLLTDGEPTAGLKDFASNVNQVSSLKEKGITVTTLGFGPEYNEELLAGMARRGGGNYYYISRPDLLPEVFRSELETMMTVAASNPRLILHLPRWTEIRQVYGYSPEFGPRRVTVHLPDIERGSTISLVAEAAYSPRPAGPYRALQAELIYEDASAGGRTQSVKADAAGEFVTDPALPAGNEDPTVQQHVELAQASRNIERTVMGMKTQQISPMTAMIELQKTQRLLIQQGRTEEADEIGKAVAELRAGGVGGAEKTLVGAVLNLDQGKERLGGG
jgi:Ca-activated chloride channel family protein